MWLITATLLNSWLYLFKVDEQYYDKSYEEFVALLNKERRPPNQFMLDGIQFEQDCVEGRIAGISEVIKDGSFQLTAMKEIKVDGVDYLLYGKLDAVKGGVVYDIKKNVRYEVGKYFDSIQHHIYMQIVPEAKKFVYLIGVSQSEDAQEATGQRFNIFTETYDRYECVDVSATIYQFINWLKEKNLIEIYHEKWRARER